jgi:hypothetical protein
MRNLLALFGAAILTFAVLGWYLGWYKIQSEPAPAGHHNVNIDVNREKIAEDVHKGVQKGEEKVESILEKDKKKADTKPQSAAPSLLGAPQPVANE